MASNNSILVAAIDFGTTYSGAALSFRHEFERDEAKIYALKLPSFLVYTVEIVHHGMSKSTDKFASLQIGNPRVSMKCMTCILIKPDGRTCHSFGEAADSHYHEELTVAERKNWYFFNRFKMELYNFQSRHLSSLELDGGHGRKLPALTVFSLSIKYLKDRIVEHCSQQLIGGLNHTEITWVLTVPAIWDDKAKAFMREAAEKAGIDANKLVIALEPEAASIFCQNIPLMRYQKDIAKLVPFQPGLKYVVLDCGGGTVDITIHEVMHRGTAKHCQMKEILKARGNDMGGTKVDKAFLTFLSSLVGDDVLRAYKDEEEDDYWELLHGFEEKKRHVKVGGSKLTISTKLIQVFEKKKGKSLSQHLQDIRNTSVSTVAGKLRIDVETAQTFFKESIDSIIRELRLILDKPETRDCKAILMVGGYSESPLLQDRVKQAFGGKDVICPNEAGLAVLKGAVIFGHNPEAIKQRISKYTYGIELKDGSFSKLVEIDEPLVVGEAQKIKTYHPPNADATKVDIIIFTTSDKNPRYTADRGCTKLDSFMLPMPDTAGGMSRTLTARMIFGGTEFIVEAKDGNTGVVKSLRVGCWD